MQNTNMKKVPVDMGPFTDFENMYSVDANGIVYSNHGRKGENYPLKQHYDKKGYVRVKLYEQNGEKHTYRVHRIVLESFTRALNPSMLKGLILSDNINTVDHINEIKDDNRLCNLRWLPRNENQKRSDKRRGEFWTEDMLNTFCTLFFKKKRSLTGIARQFRKDTRLLSKLFKGESHEEYAIKWCEKNKINYNTFMEEFRRKYPR